MDAANGAELASPTGPHLFLCLYNIGTAEREALWIITSI
jgi:hypothetical protein